MKFRVIGLLRPSHPGEYRVVVPLSLRWHEGMLLSSASGVLWDVIGWGGILLAEHSLIAVRPRTRGATISPGEEFVVVPITASAQSPPTAPLNVLLTGASGYLGLHTLARLLSMGHSVTALVRDAARLGPFAADERVRVIVGDLEAPQTIAEVARGQTVCIHTALIWGEPGTELDYPDTAATEALFEACAAAGVRRFVYVSSTAVHRPFSGRMSETDRLRTIEPYAATKAGGEAVCRRLGAVHGLQTVAVRPGPIVGPPAFAGGAFRSDRRLRSLAESAARGTPMIAPSLPDRQFVPAADVAAVLEFLARENTPIGTYLCVAKQHTKWTEIAHLAAKLADREAPVPSNESAEPPPAFDTSKLEALGFHLDATRAMVEHLRLLIEEERAGTDPHG